MCLLLCRREDFSLLPRQNFLARGATVRGEWRDRADPERAIDVPTGRVEAGKRVRLFTTLRGIEMREPLLPEARRVGGRTFALTSTGQRRGDRGPIGEWLRHGHGYSWPKCFL